MISLNFFPPTYADFVLKFRVKKDVILMETITQCPYLSIIHNIGDTWAVFYLRNDCLSLLILALWCLTVHGWLNKARVSCLLKHFMVINVDYGN